MTVKALKETGSSYAPVVLVILDGVGIGPKDEGNAWHLARTPNLDALMKLPLSRPILAHGKAVGLEGDSDLGNSEVGHNALGGGRIFDQGAKLVAQAIQDESVFSSDTWASLTEGGRTLHLIGLWSDGNIHSHLGHALALAEKALAAHCPVRFHLLLDGRDVPPRSALDYVLPLETKISDWQKAGHDVKIASGGGRMQVSMDRYEADWRIVERGWHAHVLAEGRRFPSASQAIKSLREDLDLDDQNLPAFVIGEDEAAGPIKDGDSVLFFNFRGDRAIELSRAFEAREEAFPYFERKRVPKVFFAGMMRYDGDLGIPQHYLVSPPQISETMGEYLAFTGKRQLAVAETQKFGHVTYFFNGNNSEPFNASLERYVEVPSDRVIFSERPWMKAAEIVDETLAQMDEFQPDFVRLNLANGDMVGHTGDLQAAMMAMEAMDLSLGRLREGLRKRGATMVLVADHGNCEEMFERDKATGAILKDEMGQGVPRTSHTINPVPFVVEAEGVAEHFQLRELEDAGLANLASTCLMLMGLEIPSQYLPSLLVGSKP